jgi:hypothetical protein
MFSCANLLTRFAPAWQQENVNSRSWSGVIINSGCTADEAFAESDKCYENRGPAAKLSLYDDTTRQGIVKLKQTFTIFQARVIDARTANQQVSSRPGR